MSNEVHVTYYAEHTDSPDTWSSPSPSFDIERFQRDITRRTGTIDGKTRFRIRWAGDKEEFMLEDYDIQTGWIIYENGQERHVSMKHGDAAIPTTAIVAPFYENFKVFTPRFVIEELLADGLYHKCWFVETVKELGGENGRVDVLSSYREPSEMDLKMLEHLRYLRDSLSKEDIEKGVLAQKMREAAAKQNARDEMVDEMAEDFCRAITDGIPDAAPVKSYNNFDIKRHSKGIMSAHNGA
jgi:hypothetical protein